MKPSERYDRNITTTNFKLKRTVGTRTDFTFEDKRTGANWGFDAVRVGISLGRGDVVQFYVDDSANEEIEPAVREGREVGSVYQDDLPDELLVAFEHLEDGGELPVPNFVR